LKIFVLTDCPSPYQVELFNEIEACGECELEVAYLRQRDPNRQWKSPDITHRAISLEEANERVRNADLVVFNYYRHPNAEQLLCERTTHGGPWCFWGERPGFHQPAWAGRLMRKWKLKSLHATHAPIWGIGRFAIDGYRTEFGAQRAYFNLPYFSNLKRFAELDQRGAAPDRVFLFSGSLIRRKGVDLLARAFVRLAREMPNVRLRIIGEGELRRTVSQTLHSVKERVEFVGFKDWDELPHEYARADVLCVPSRYDGWGLVVPEGLAAGLPVIATDRMGAALEFLETGRNGWLIPASDEDAILNAMREAASLPLAEMSRNARESISNHTLQHGACLFTKIARESASSLATNVQHIGRY
jgi:glycosyltransferase involved in cell wall biosynthesis